MSMNNCKKELAVVGGGEIEAAAVAADAGTDILQAILQQLGDPLGIGEELLRRVNIALYPAKVDAVLFKDIVVQ